MSALLITDVSVAFGTTTVLDHVSLSVADGEILALLGPSGSGKSTLLRVVAGLLAPDAGRVEIDGVDVTRVATHRRGVGMVFQDEQLFPHRDVGENVAFGLRMTGVGTADRTARVEELLALVGLSGFARRSVTSLSGGEAKRVALARALAPAPRVLLLDEPLTGLDADLHDRLAVDLRAVLTRIGTTAVHVTHDRSEATVVADRIVTLDELGGRDPVADHRHPDDGSLASRT
jgi:thiamine transport system ATP-binding protein